MAPIRANSTGSDFSKGMGRDICLAARQQTSISELAAKDLERDCKLHCAGRFSVGPIADLYSLPSHEMGHRVGPIPASHQSIEISPDLSMDREAQPALAPVAYCGWTMRRVSYEGKACRFMMVSLPDEKSRFADKSAHYACEAYR